jgi:leucyl/phenylalanyl-tRNA---protein transferase
MPWFCFDENAFQFPPLEEADEEGLLLIGGNVTPQRVLAAYQLGIFPWYNDDSLPLWWSPDPRFVLFPNELHVSKSMQKIISKNNFELRINTAFEQVISNCASTRRKEVNGTWLTQSMQNVYVQLHKAGYAHSAEAWHDGQLVGGVYGLRLGHIFFGESMFSAVSNASKFAFIKYTEHLRASGTALIDCQVYTNHVESLGARLIDRAAYLQLLHELI